jgi:hypothetical protein
VAAHFDSSCTAPGAPLERKLSLSVFLGSARDDADPAREAADAGADADADADGAELLFDEVSGCWRSLSATPDLLLISLSDRIGAPPSDRKWRDEWNALKLEAIVLSGQGEFASEEYVNESCTVEKTTKQNHAAIVKLVNSGWYPHEAIAYRLLSSVSPPNWR